MTKGTWWRIAAASLVAMSVTLVVLQRVWGTPSSRPLGDCGKHDGLVVLAGDASVTHQRRDLIRQWNAMPGQTQQATLIEPNTSVDSEHSQEVAAEQARSCAFDVLELDTPWTAEFAERGFVVPVDDSWMDDPSDFFGSVMETVKWRGRQYAVPWTTDAGLLYLHGTPPSPPSWNELLSAGYATQLRNYEGLTVNALEVIWNTEGVVLSGPVEKVDVKTARVILNGLRRLAGVTKALPESRSWDEPATVNAFVDNVDNKASIMRNWPYVFRSLTADSRIGRSFEFQLLPRPGYTVLGGQSLAVSAYSKHKDDARKLIRFMTGKKSENHLYACGGYPPTRPSALGNDPTCPIPKNPDPDTPTQERFDQFTTTLKAALQNALPRPTTPYYGQFSETFRGCVIMVLNNRAPSPEKLADALNAALKGKHGTCGG